MITLRILLIDREPRWIKFAKDSLVEFTLDVASDATEALEKLNQEQFDLVIASSLHLKALEKIMQDYADQPLFIATTEPNRREERTAYLLGAKRYISKKFDPDSLKNEIEIVVPNAT